MERRKKEIPVAFERRNPRGGREIVPNSDSITSRQYTDEEWEFIKAIDDYKRRNLKPFPTWPEVLSVAISLGYRKQG